MNIITYEITGKNADQITTEIIFFLTSAKTLGYDLIKLNMKSIENRELNEKRKALSEKILKSVKRRGMIQLFISSVDFENTSTESIYLCNKYPDLKLTMQGDGEDSFILKL